MYDRDFIINSKQTDVGVKHHFSNNIYAKEMHLPQGHIALSHKHEYSHLSCLAQGKCIVMTNGSSKIYEAPTMIEIKKGIEHQIEAIEDVVWYCIHATDETDENKIDEVLIGQAVQ